MNITPNYTDLGLSSPMSIELRKVVESQLLDDLKNYSINWENLKFDWSESCIEGHLSEHLDSLLENYSGIKLFDENDNLIFEGWMEFINDYDEINNCKYFIAFWDYLDVYENGSFVNIKTEPGLPTHILKILPENLKLKFNNEQFNKHYR